MKHVNNYLTFKQSLTESAVAGLGDLSSFGKSVTSNKSLIQATQIIAKFLSKKLKKEYKIVPTIVTVKGVNCIEMYTEKDNTMIRVCGSTTAGQIVGSLSIFKDYINPTADLTITSENFSIVALLNEFVKLVSDSKYAAEVLTLTESLVNEARSKMSAQEVKIVEDRLKNGETAMTISKDLGVPYGQILKVSKGEYMPADEAPAVIKNTMTLEDKTKFLDETLQDIYDISGRVAAGAFNSLFISGRAGTGKTYSVLKAVEKEGLVMDKDFAYVSGAVSVAILYRKLFQYRDKLLVFDDADAVFKDENGRNILKAALDTKKVRRVSYMKKSGDLFDPMQFEDNPEGEMEAIEAGLVPSFFDFYGKVIFISNLPKDKADPDGAIRSRSILIDVNPDDATLMERIRTLLPHLEPIDMDLKSKMEIFEFMKRSKDVSMRTFVKAAGFKQAGMKNWERMAQRYV